MSRQSTPIHRLERLLEQLNHSFEETALALERGDPLDAIEAPFTSWQEGYTWMSVDVIEREDEVVVMADLPGFEKDEIDLRVTDSTLVIEAEHEEAMETEEEGRFLRRERRRQGLYRSIDLPTGIEKTDISASMKSGVLTVHLPKAEETEDTRIEISEETA